MHQNLTLAERERLAYISNNPQQAQLYADREDFESLADAREDEVTDLTEKLADAENVADRFRESLRELADALTQCHPIKTKARAKQLADLVRELADKANPDAFSRDLYRVLD